MKVYMKTDYEISKGRTLKKGDRLNVTNALGKIMVDAGAAREILPFSIPDLPPHLTQALPILTRQSKDEEEE